MNTGHTWALVLAAGEGSRLSSMTTTSSGVVVPKQFCSLRGGPSLLHEALGRAQTIAAREHICAVVAQQHSLWWATSLQSLPEHNVIVQPQNCGTAIGIFWPLLHILGRDADAKIVLLPADHHVRHESVLASALQRAVAHLNTVKSQLILLGLAPEEADPELGYIVPGDTDECGLSTVDRFEEKPNREIVPVLIRQGALWSTFIVVARARAMLRVLAMKIPRIVRKMQAAVAHDALDTGEPVAVAHVYRTLPEIDFSRLIASNCKSVLRVMAVSPCGWTDLGTPKRVVNALRGLAVGDDAPDGAASTMRGHVTLSNQSIRLPATVQFASSWALGRTQ